MEICEISKVTWQNIQRSMKSQTFSTHRERERERERERLHKPINSQILVPLSAFVFLPGEGGERSKSKYKLTDIIN